MCRLKSDIGIRFMLIYFHFFNRYTLFMILINKYGQNLFRHSDGSILDKNIKSDRTAKDGSGLLFFVAASLILSFIIFYTS